MATEYVLRCRDAGADCDFEVRGSSIDDVMQRCADHAISKHNLKAFGPELYTKMRRCLQAVDGKQA
jgi:predicted small metal-binding protein